MQRVAARLRAGHTIVVPASVANLGPGFDTLGVAVGLYLRVRIAAVVRDGRGRLECRFDDGPLAGPNRIEEAFRAFPSRRRGAPSLVVDVHSDIPLRSGLGSSAAATIAGLRLGALAHGRIGLDRLLTVATKMEGHPDNAAPALLGGVTSCCVKDDGSVGVTHWPWPSKWRIVVATPEAELATPVARRALPRTLPLGDAIFNLQHLGLLLGALHSANPSDFREALRDRAHQPYREQLVPGLRRVLQVRHPDVIGFCLSGAGPSIAAFTTGRTAAAERILKDTYRRERLACTVRTVKVHREGDA